jgi:hypothetical protein
MFLVWHILFNLTLVYAEISSGLSIEIYFNWGKFFNYEAAIFCQHFYITLLSTMINLITYNLKRVIEFLEIGFWLKSRNLPSLIVSRLK